MALVLTRRLGESIIIDGNIKASVVSLGGGQVKIAIEAPDDINLVRDELLQEGDTFYDDENVTKNRNRYQNRS